MLNQEKLKRTAPRSVVPRAWCIRGAQWAPGRHQPQEYPTRLEAGTLNGHGIAGLSAALDYIGEVVVPDVQGYNGAASGLGEVAVDCHALHGGDPKRAIFFFLREKEAKRTVTRPQTGWGSGIAAR